MKPHAPRQMTIVIAAILLIAGIAGTFLRLIPDVAGYSGTTWGVALYVLATVLLLAGVYVRGL